LDEHVAHRVVEGASGEPDGSGVQAEQSGDGAQEGRLAGAVGPEHRDDLAGLRLDRHVEVELPHAHHALERERHVATGRSHLSRNPTSTSTATAISGSASAGASAGSCWNTLRTSVGSVCVAPGTLPPNSSVAPNSPSARAQHSTDPAMIAGITSGTVTRRKM